MCEGCPEAFLHVQFTTTNSFSILGSTYMRMEKLSFKK